MRGEHANGKGDKNRLSNQELKKYENSKLWANLDKKKLEQAQKEGRIIFIDERDDIPQYFIDELKVKR